MKFVRQYFKQTGHPGKYKFISRYWGYHGGTAGGMAASGNGIRRSKFEPQMSGFLKVFPPTHYRDRYSWEEANRIAAESIGDVIAAEDPETVAGVILEPIGNTGGGVAYFAHIGGFLFGVLAIKLFANNEHEDYDQPQRIPVY